MINVYQDINIRICWNSQYFKNVFPRRCVWHSQKLLPGMFGLARAGHIADYTTEDGKNGVLSIVAIPTNTRRRFNSNHANTTLRDQSMLRCSASFMCNLIYTNKSFVIAHDNLQKTKAKRVITFSDRLIHCKIGSKVFRVKGGQGIGLLGPKGSRGRPTSYGGGLRCSIESTATIDGSSDHW